MQVPATYFDEIYSFKGNWDMPSECGLKIRKRGDKIYVIVIELYQDNPGTSVTYAGKSLAEQICASKGFNLSDIIYIECNPDTSSKLSFYDEEYFEVTFNAASQPAYRQLTKEEIETIFN
ncbi:MAG: hypothetical protein LBM68_00620 [Bacteroidales bacterium]|jgi:hypothetical protein|nr:hypothetical protein [Bacteroidales bacterium]